MIKVIFSGMSTVGFFQKPWHRLLIPVTLYQCISISFKVIHLDFVHEFHLSLVVII